MNKPNCQECGHTEHLGRCNAFLPTLAGAGVIPAQCDCSYRPAPDTVADVPSDEDKVFRARMLHDLYELHAPKFGYVTREDTADFDPDSPNGRLMTYVVDLFCEAEYGRLQARESRLREVARQLQLQVLRHGIEFATLREEVEFREVMDGLTAALASAEKALKGE